MGNNPLLRRLLTDPDGLVPRLTAIRESVPLSQVALGEAAGWSESKVSRISNGIISPSISDIEKWCLVCGVPEMAIELIEIRGKAHAIHVAWDNRTVRGHPDIQTDFVDLHRQASKLVVVETTAIPGSLQTPAYGHAMLSALRDPDAVVNVDESVAMRMERATLLDEQDPDRSYEYVIGEEALYRGPGTAEVMIGALERLSLVVDYPTVDIWILPLVSPMIAIPIVPFEIYTIDGNDLGLVEMCDGLSVIPPSGIPKYLKNFEIQRDHSVTGDEAKAMIDAAIDRHQLAVDHGEHK